MRQEHESPKSVVDELASSGVVGASQLRQSSGLVTRFRGRLEAAYSREMTADTGAIRVVDFEPRWRADFARLNIEWLERWFTVEAVDREVLGDPESHILGPGGRILFAVDRAERALVVVPRDQHTATASDPVVRERWLPASTHSPGRIALPASGRVHDLGAERVLLISRCETAGRSAWYRCSAV